MDDFLNIFFYVYLLFVLPVFCACERENCKKHIFVVSFFSRSSFESILFDSFTHHGPIIIIITNDASECVDIFCELDGVNRFLLHDSPGYCVCLLERGVTVSACADAVSTLSGLFLLVEFMAYLFVVVFRHGSRNLHAFSLDRSFSSSGSCAFVSTMR